MNMKPNLPSFDAPPTPVTLPTPLSFHVLIHPRAPKATSAGGIALPGRTRRANRATDYVGQLVAVGALAFKARVGELDMTAEPNWPQLNDWVVYRMHAGQKLRIHKDQQELIDGDEEDEDYVLLCHDTDVVATFKSEEEANRFYSWVR